MAEIPCLFHLHEDEEDHGHAPEHIDTLHSLPYWGLYDFDSFNVFVFGHHPIAAHTRELFQTRLECSLHVQAVDDVSKLDSITTLDLLDRKNQVRFVLNLFHQRVEQLHVM